MDEFVDGCGVLWGSCISRQITADHSRSQQITAYLSRSRQITAYHGISRQITADHGRSQQITADHGRSRHITADHGRSRQITVDHGRSRQITADYGRSRQSRQITADLPCHGITAWPVSRGLIMANGGSTPMFFRMMKRLKFTLLIWLTS